MIDLQASRVAELRAIANRVRAQTLEAVYRAGGGHIGASFSAAEIMTVLYFEVMRVDPQRPDWPERDRFILSKGHAAAGYYGVLAERGFIPRDWPRGFDRLNYPYHGHPNHKEVPGVEVSTGALGQGLSFGVGVALGARLDRSPVRAYVLLGDGELDEGSNWEAAMAAAAWKLDNLCAIVDHNKIQQGGYVNEVMPLGDLPAKWRAFGWETIECDGHDPAALIAAFEHASSTKGAPTCVIAHTVKAGGVSFMAGVPAWHFRVPTDEEMQRAFSELGLEWNRD